MDEDSYPPPGKRGRRPLAYRLNPWLTPEEEARVQISKPSTRATPAAGTAKQTLSTSTLGYDSETEDVLTLSDPNRRAGLYVLGRSGTGKSALLINLIDQDLKHGHGVFFLDPHGDAIADVIRGGPLNRLSNDLILLDPKDKTHSFGINLLACRDVTNFAERNTTYTRAYEVFKKLWEREWEERPWLQLIVQYVIYVFLENPDYTLGDVPRFLTDPAFRNHLVSNVRYKWRAREFWQHAFQEKQAEAALTRVHRLLGDEYVEHIVSQRQTTINFAEILDKRQIVLLRLSPSFPSDVKRFIGTIVVSELLQAIQTRADIPPDKRHQFCIFVDEFQNFASFEDFTVLFTQARKFGIATTVAHQERFGQFGENKAILGATDAAANKVFFQLTVRDAAEQAPEFAKPPLMETRQEEKLCITNYPFERLLTKAHENEVIRRFTRTYLLPLKERLDDQAAGWALLEIQRKDFLDRATLARLDAQLEGIYDSLHSSVERKRALERAKEEVTRARQQLAIMQDSWHRSRVTTETIRSLDRVFVAIMEGDLVPQLGDERFSQFLIECARHSSRVPWQCVDVLSLYISLKYGDPNTPRAIPLAFAKRRGVFPDDVARVLQETEENTNRAREHFRERFLAGRWRVFSPNERYEITRRENERIKKQAEVKLELLSGLEDIVRGIRYARNLYFNYVWFRMYPDLRELLTPYWTKTFTGRWKHILDDFYWKREVNVDDLLQKVLPCLRGPGMLREDMMSELSKFLQQYRDSAFVILTLINVAKQGSWLPLQVYRRPRPFPYPCMVDFPGLSDTDPIETLRVVKALNECMQAKIADFGAFLDAFVTYFNKDPHRHYKLMEDTSSVGILAKVGHFFTGKPFECFDRKQFLDDLVGESKFTDRSDQFVYGTFVFNIAEHREDVRVLQHAMTDDWQVFTHKYPLAASRWTWCDDLTRAYLLARACDLVYFGEEIADVTFPKPLFPGANELVAALTRFLQETQQRLSEERIRKEAEKYRQYIEEEVAEKAALISVDLPAHLPARVLSDTEREWLTAVCLEDLLQSAHGGWNAQGTLKVIEEFARVCRLLSMPENWIKDRSSQFTARLVPSRTVDDMTNEMRQELINLPKYTAYAKVLHVEDEKQIVLKRKIRTFPPLSPSVGDRLHLERAALERTHAKHSRRRDLIEQELWHRHTQWREADARKAAARQKQRDRSPPPKKPDGQEPPPEST